MTLSPSEFSRLRKDAQEFLDTDCWKELAQYLIDVKHNSIQEWMRAKTLEEHVVAREAYRAADRILEAPLTLWIIEEEETW